MSGDHDQRRESRHGKRSGAQSLGVGDRTPVVRLDVGLISRDERRLLLIDDTASLYDVGRDHVPR